VAQITKSSMFTNIAKIARIFAKRSARRAAAIRHGGGGGILS
jgi:hypothetical protein